MHRDEMQVSENYVGELRSDSDELSSGIFGRSFPGTNEIHGRCSF